MNGHKRSRVANKPVIRTFKLAPTTRAIRAALFGSVAMLALAGPGAAYAGTCATNAPNAIACNGDFADSVPGFYDSLVDLTLVLGDTAPTSVTPAAGVVGLNISSQANVGVVSHADISTVDADGLHIDGATAVMLVNDGSISTDANLAGASAIDISALGDITIINSGALNAYSSGDYLGATAVTATATTATGNVRFDNLADGTITAGTTGYSSAAIGVSITTSGGSAVVNNDGDISATATSNSGLYANGAFSHDSSRAIGLLINSGGDITVVNTGSISAASQTESIVNGFTVGVAAYSFNGAGAISVTNTETGSIESTATLTAVGAMAIGGFNYFTLGTTGTVNNAGSISAEALGMGTFTGYAPFSSSLAVGVFSAHTNNSGDITATAHGDFGLARGIWGSQSIDNSGTILADGSDGRGNGAQGVFLQSYGSDATINNSGSITAYASGNAVGVSALEIYGSLAINNSGTIANFAVPGVQIFNATGINAQSYGGDLTVANSGDITLECGNKCYGLYTATVGGNTIIDNSGAITLSGRYYEQGIRAIEIGGALTLTNSGSISVDSSAGVIGVGGVRIVNVDRITYAGDNISLDDQTTTFTNSGSISAIINAPAGADYLPLLGQVARAISIYSQSGAVVIDNSGTVIADSYSYSAFAGGAVGISVSSNSGDIAIDSSGSILANSETSSVYKGGFAAGIYSLVNRGDIDIATSGTISAIAISDYASDNGQTQAIGVMGVSTHGDITINNASTGVITADASTLVYNTAAAYGVYARTTAGNLDLNNDGNISATSKSQSIAYLSSYGQTTAMGIGVANLFGDHTTIGNSGNVSAVASTTALGAAHAFGISVYASSPYAVALITNTGTVTASAHADGHTDVDDAATAIGLSMTNRYGGTSSITNSGTIAADASSYLSSRANGVSIDASNLAFTSSGDISATATADATAGTVLATGLVATGGSLNIGLGLGSTLTATASGYDGTAIGLLVAGDAVAASNAGAIDATFTGGTDGRSYGAILVGNGNVAFTNSGWITAGGTGPSVGIELSSDVSTTLVNSGTISGGTAILTGDSADSINNVGTVTGAIFTNGGNDLLTNGVGGLWYAGGSSDFGSGADAITNAGTIVLNNSSIALGDSDTFANAFDNSGTIFSFGDSVIAMGAGNTNAFTNTGIIDFRDGHPDDILTINGDFAGSGALGVDVSGLNGTADLLYVTGNVANGSVTTVNTTILDVPTTPTGSVAVVKVSGDSTAGNFVLGDVAFNPNQSFLFVTGVGMSSNIDTSNAVADVFSIDFAVTGLSDAGTLAASFAPGVQSLMNSQVGTWRQRMGVIDKAKTHGFSLWGRTFTDSGTINPGHVASTFGQGGNFTFDQRNDGGEAGVDFGINEQFSVGLLAGQARATQHLNETGIGSTKIDGDTSGVYATWFSPNGFYVDTSFRHMRFDAKLNSAAGESRTHGSANTFNVETGYAFELGDGYKIEPQLQYTHTTVGSADVVDGALTGFSPDGGTSSRGRAGVAVRKSFPTDGRTILTPYVAVSAVHEFDGENRYAINDTFFGTTSTKGTSALVEGGVNVQVGKLAVFGGLNWQDGGALKSFTGGQLGVRYSW